jgi:hypothetical protein
MGRMGRMDETLREKIEKALREWKYGNSVVGSYTVLMMTEKIINLVRKEIKECLK